MLSPDKNEIKRGDRFRGKGRIGPGQRTGTVIYTVICHDHLYTAFRAGGVREQVWCYRVRREPPYAGPKQVALVSADTLVRMKRLP